MKKRIISAALSAALLLSSAATAYALPQTADTSGDASAYDLPEKSEDGVILHCFDWSFKTIKENLPEIAAAGYKTIQTSPVQQPKDYGPWSNSEDQWWKLYQPVSFSVATKDSWLGTKDELADLCAEAEKYGINVICDIVSNHMANLDGDHYLSDEYKNLSPLIGEYEEEIYNNYTKYFHMIKREINDNKIQYLLQGEMNKLPDLDTSNDYVQKRVIHLLEECIDCGVDGFRFDAAKHIETPADGDYASNFWPNVIDAANKHAAEKGVELYYYGEILNSPGANRQVSEYTKYIHITDNTAGNVTLASVGSENAVNALKAQAYFHPSEPARNLVLWAESHDTYMAKTTRKYTANQIAKAWAVVGSRADAQALYLARPNDLMGLAGDSAWKSTVVSEVNKFHNHFVGTGDSVYTEGNVLAVQRGDSGIVLVSFDDKTDISVPTQGMKDGTYIDTVSGSTFTVANGVIKGKTNETGIAVVYEGAALTPNISFSAENTSFNTPTFKLTLTAENAQSATYSIDGAAPVSFSGTTDVILGEGVEEGKTITVKTVAVNGDKTVEETHTYYKETVEHSGVTVYFTNEVKQWSSVFIYAFHDDANKNNIAKNGNWPGVKMNYDEENDRYYYEIPLDVFINSDTTVKKEDLTSNDADAVNKAIRSANSYVIFTDGKGNQTKDLFLKTKCSVYSANKNRLLEYDPVLGILEVDSDTATDTSTDKSTDKSTDTSTDKSTDTKSDEVYIFGDVTNDGDVMADDAVAILRYSSHIDESFTEEQKKLADVDEDEEITANDAVFILRYSVGFNDAEIIGTEYVKPASKPSKPDESTDTDTKPSDVLSGDRTLYLLNGKKGAGNGGLFDDGCKLWIFNNDTKEAIETIKSEDTDTAKYAYATIPASWVNLTIYRTAWQDSDVSNAYRSWNITELQGPLQPDTKSIALFGTSAILKDTVPDA